MPTLLVKNIELLATFDDARREISDGALLVRDNVIEQVGTNAEMAGVTADRSLDLADHIVMPGMVNTHHHMYQNLTRVMVQDDELFTWLTTLYPIWAELDDEAIYVSARVAMAELIQSGCTTSSDHLYIMPNNCRLDSEIRAAREMGMRFHAARGAMSRGKSQGGLPPDRCVEKEDAILKDAERVIHEYHDASRHAMSRIILAPCSPFSVTPGLMKEAAQLARAHPGVHLHSHLAEDLDEETYCQTVYGMRSVDFAASVDWLGPDVWFAHAIFLNDREVKLFADTGTGMTHCPSANMRCGQGIAKIRQIDRHRRQSRPWRRWFSLERHQQHVPRGAARPASAAGGARPLPVGGAGWPRRLRRHAKGAERTRGADHGDARRGRVARAR